MLTTDTNPRRTTANLSYEQIEQAKAKAEKAFRSIGFSEQTGNVYTHKKATVNEAIGKRQLDFMINFAPNVNAARREHKRLEGCQASLDNSLAKVRGAHDTVKQLLEHELKTQVSY